LRGRLAGTHRDQQRGLTASHHFARRGEGRQIAQIVADHHDRTRTGFGDDAPDRVAFVAVDRRSKLPNQPARDHFEAAPSGNVLDRLIDRRRPLVGISDAPGVNGDGIFFVFQECAARDHGGRVAQVFGGCGDGRTRRN